MKTEGEDTAEAEGVLAQFELTLAVMRGDQGRRPGPLVTAIADTTPSPP